jgi:Family of unknown function (DUF6603)
LDIRDVKAKVDGHISGDLVLTLRPNSDLNAPAVDAVIHTYFADVLSGTVHLVNGQTAIVDEVKQTALYSLSLSAQNFSLCKSESPLEAGLTFAVKHDTIQCRIEVTLPKGYALSNTFSALKNAPDLAINKLALENSVLTLASDVTPVSHFTADLLPTGPLEQLAWLLPNTMPLAGSIDFTTEGGQQFPFIDLTTPDLAHLSVGTLTLQLSVRVRSSLVTVAAQPSQRLFTTHVELVTAFKTSDLTVPVVLPVHGEGQYLQAFYLDITKPKPPINSLKALSGLTGNTDPGSLLNPELKIGGATLSLDSMGGVFDPVGKALLSIDVGVSLGLDWTIIANVLELVKIGAFFSLADPAHAKRENLSARLFAELKVGSVHLDTTVLLPERTVMAQMAPGDEIDIIALIGQFAPGLQLPGNDSLSVRQLEVFAQAKKGQEAYSFESAASGTLTIIKGLTLDEIHFFVRYASGAVSSARLSSTLTLTNVGVDLRLLAAYGHDNGWQFDGSTGPGQAIPIGHLIADIAGMFGAVTVPEAIADLSIKDLSTSFNTKTKDFDFTIEADFGKDAATVLTFSNLHQDGAQPPTFERRATGVIKVLPGQENELDFDLGIDLKSDGKYFVALYSNPTGQALTLDTLVHALFPDAGSLSGIPKFSITIKDAIVGYASTTQAGRPVSESIFALDMGATLDLTSLGNIPLVGQSLAAAKSLTLAFQILYPALPTGTSSFSKTDLAALNALITVAGPRLPADQDLTGLSLKTGLRLGAGDPIAVNLPVTVDSKTGQLQNSGGSFDTPAGAQATDDGVKWFQLNKEFGPVHLQRVGLKFDQGDLSVKLAGGLSAFGLEVDLMGLSVTSSITDVQGGKFYPRFGLDGLGVSFAKGGVSFAGALLRLETKNGYEYDGLASVQAEGLRLAAIGSLSTINDQPSLFLYAVLDYPLGGAPFFYVTGLAGGFGLNQTLIMPAVDKVATFPLIQTAKQPPSMPTDPGSAGPFIAKEMGALAAYLKPTVGQYFGCAGVQFTSFELLDSFVLISLSFGREFELDLLGISTLIVPSQLPPAEPPLASVTLQIVASFIPDQGIASVQGRLTPDSHILDPKCHLTGGFAFATWFGLNPHAGDFVITLGGYHPSFQKPDHYPTVPRVGIDWQISSELNVTGGLYFALTPRALMAGGAMRAVFQTSLDIKIATIDVKAWFLLGADFIVYWKPFHYSAHLYVDIGIDVVIHFLGTHDIGLDAGADLQVWGPAFGGRAHVTLTVIGIRIGFDIAFGATAPTPPPLVWDDTDATKSFRKSFLPADDKIVSVAIAEGLVRTVSVAKAQASDGSNDEATEVWSVINPSGFRVRTSSVIPIKQVATAIPTTGVAANTVFGIAAMDKGNDQVQTFHQITLTGDGPSIASQLAIRPILQHVPGGLWAEHNSSDVNATLMIENTIVGYEIAPGEPPISGHTQPIKRDLLQFTPQTVDHAFVDDAIGTFAASVPNPGDDPAANLALWNRIQAEIHSNPTRDAMLAAMGFGAGDLDIGASFGAAAAYAPSYGALNH